MILKSQTVRQMILLSLIVLIIPLLIFPERFGTALVSFSIAFLIAEMVYYGSITYWSNRQASLMQLAAGAGICLIYRFLLGLTFGVLIWLRYSMNINLTFKLVLISYIPSIICQVIITPFILRTVLNDWLFKDKKRPRLVIDSLPANKPSASPSEINSRKLFSEQRETNSMTPWAEQSKKQKVNHEFSPGKNINGFDRATQYISENGSVMMAVVVDEEGLLLSHFVRENISLDDWAPLALLFRKSNNQVLDRVGMKNVGQVTLTIENMRVTVVSENGLSLMVLADIQQDDVMNIRITQGMEIIRKYMAERYSQELFVNAEKKYV
ncbi:MAG: hypothetical protein ABIJ12_10275 [bacterium]